MRLSISNIAWDIGEDKEIQKLLAKYRIDAIDIAPTKYFSDPINVRDADIDNVRMAWLDRGIEITGMQSLLFGTAGLNVFAADDVQEKMLSHLAGICRIGARLGATRLVFGSPKNRDRQGLNDEQVVYTAKTFFGKLGNIASDHGVCICLEPNPTCYGANFMVTSTETAMIVREVNHPAIKMQLDTGAIYINQENAAQVLIENADVIGHVHISEAGLVPLGDSDQDHQKISEALQKYLPDHVVTIEMLATKDEAHVKAIDRALSCAVANYRDHYGANL